MIVRILGEKDTKAYALSIAIIDKLGHKIVGENCGEIDLAIAPLLTQKVPDKELYYPKFGTLIFHPSPLPYGRGKSAIKMAYKRGEPITAATWFWADEKFDAGDICEMEIVKIDYKLPPREFYERDILPALGRTLERAIIDIANGSIRRIKQIEKYATYD